MCLTCTKYSNQKFAFSNNLTQLTLYVECLHQAHQEAERTGEPSIWHPLARLFYENCLN